ncbi:MAG: pyridoxamine 5'-phosphate oxidase family protein [Candidatus Thermoplasmatota archaeon]|nr:pyridoxamine 5'-phosphate oxidase family protein [Candidatus Thermoplasmatota archaeon]
MNKKDRKKRIQQLIESQRFAVIATENNRKPYMNLVAFASTDDLRVFIFSTKQDTQKYLNITENNNIAVLIDNRQNTPADLSNAVAVTAYGTAYETKNQKKEYQQLLLRKHPDLAAFLDDPSCVLIEIRVRSYQVVEQFENVNVVKMTDREN